MSSQGSVDSDHLGKLGQRGEDSKLMGGRRRAVRQKDWAGDIRRD